MTLIERIPHLNDMEVENLLANARRLQTGGDAKQQAAANDILPTLELVSAERKTAQLEAAQVKRAASRKTKKVAAEAEVEADEEADEEPEVEG